MDAQEPQQKKVKRKIPKDLQEQLQSHIQNMDLVKIIQFFENNPALDINSIGFNPIIILFQSWNLRGRDDRYNTSLMCIQVLELLRLNGLNYEHYTDTLLDKIFLYGLGNVLQWYLQHFDNPFLRDSLQFARFTMKHVLWTYVPYWFRWFVWLPEDPQWPRFQHQRLFDPNKDVLSLEEQNAIALFKLYLRLSPEIGDDELLTQWISSQTSANPNQLNKEYWANMVREELRAREGRALMETISIPERVGFDFPHGAKQILYYKHLDEPIMTMDEINELKRWRHEVE